MNGLEKLILKIYDPIPVQERIIKISTVRWLVLPFLLIYFHWFNKQPFFKLDLLNLTELLYLIYIILGEILIRVAKFISIRQISKVIIDFIFITIFLYFSLSLFGFHSWIYVLYLIPIVFCGYWFKPIATFVFVFFVSTTYLSLHYFLLNLEDIFKIPYTPFNVLGPVIGIFYLTTMGVIYYKKSSEKVLDLLRI